MSATRHIVAPGVVRITCDHRHTTVTTGSLQRCTVCGMTWSVYTLPPAHVRLEQA